MSTSNFKSIPGISDYSVCLVTGSVRDDRSGRHLNCNWGRAGTRYYWQVSVRGQTYRVHRLVAAAAAGRELVTGEQVCHVDGNTGNNSWVNLRIGSAKDNAQDRILHGTNGYKLRNQDVRDIRMLAERIARSVLALRYGISLSHLSGIIARRRWAGLV